MATKTLLETRFGGIIKSGKHEEDGQCCILEYRSACMGISWTDSPEKTRTFDIRSINDADWSSDQLRTKWLLKLEKAVGGSLDWSKERQRAFINNVCNKTMQVLIANLPGLTMDVVSKCKNASNSAEAAEAAAWAARAACAAWAAEAAEAAEAAAWAARAARAARAAWAAEAAEAARAAAWAARAAWAAAKAAAWAAEDAGDKILIRACQLWIDAAKETEGL